MRTTIRELRLARGWTQKQLATETGIPAKRISKFETGKLGPTPKEIRWLCQALGTPARQLRVPPARPRGGQQAPTRELLGRFRVPPPPLPPAECTSGARLASLRREYSVFMQRVEPRLISSKNFLDTVASECNGETLFQLRELEEGADFTFVTLDWLGYDRWPSVDLKTGQATGHCLRPALITRDWIMVFQVTVQTPRQKYRMDAMVFVVEPQRTVLNVEVDGKGHDSSQDKARGEALGILTIRVRDEEILTGPNLTERLRQLGFCQKRAA